MSIVRNVLLNIEDNSITLDQDLIFYTGNNDVILNMVFPKAKYATGSHIPTKYTVLCLTPDNQIETTLPELIIQSGNNYELNFQVLNSLVGVYKLQIVLMDNYSHIRLPEFRYQVIRGIDGLEEEKYNTNAIVGTAETGESVLREGSALLSEYVSETWYTGDVITSNKINNLANGVDKAIETAENSYSYATTAQQTSVAANTKATDALNGLQNKAAINHTHTKSNITDFAHTHNKTDIANFPSKLSEFVNDIGAGGGTGGDHSHSNMSTLNEITPFKVAEWNDRVIPSDFEILKNEIEYARMGEENLSDIITSIDAAASAGLYNSQQNTSQIADITQQIEDMLVRLSILEGGTIPKEKIYNIPKLNLTGDTTGISDTVKVTLGAELLDIYGEPIFTNKKCKLSWQGNSSLNWIKKNFAISLLENDGSTKFYYKFFDDVSTNDGYHLKSDWEDAIRMRNNVSCKIAEKMYSTVLPTSGRGIMDGFPIQIFINGTYQGLYHWNLKQHKTVYNLDTTNPNHLMYRTNNSSALTCRFKALSVDNSADITTDWEDRFPETNTSDNRAKLNRVIQWVISCNGNPTKFKNELTQYFNKEYLLKYTVFAYVAGLWDNISNNFNLVTYDGEIWYPTLYDIDGSWGYHYSTCPISSSYAFPSQYAGGDNSLFVLVMSAFKDNELKDVYQSLRQNVLSYSNIIAEFDAELERINQIELTKDTTKWSSQQPSYGLVETKTWIQQRLDFVDSDLLPTQIVLTGLSLNKSSTTINTGSTDTLTVSYTPSNTTQQGITWSSSNTGIATVDSNGVVTGVANGTCTITATSTANNSIVATCSVTVQTATINVTGVTLNKSTTSINQGSTETLVATIVPSNATNKNVTWSSSNTSIATVSSSGVVTGVASGTATITVTTVDGSKTAICSLTIVSVDTVLLCDLQATNHGADNNTWADLSGKGNDANLVNVNQNGTTDGWISNTLKLSKGTGYVKLNSNFDTLKEFTLEVKGTFNCDGLTYIVGKRETWNNMLFDLFTKQNGLEVIIETQQETTIFNTSILKSNCVLKVYVNVNTNTVIINVDGTTIFTKTDCVFTYPNSSSPITILGSPDAVSERGAGTIDYIKLYSTNKIS